jgi:hypothetical protein
VVGFPDMSGYRVNQALADELVIIPVPNANSVGKREMPTVSGPFLPTFCLPKKINPSKIRRNIRENLLKVCMPKISPPSKS